MPKKEFDFVNRRNVYRKRRNNIRRVFLFLFVVVFFCFINKLLSLPLKKAIKIEVINNKLIKDSFIESQVSDFIKPKNFFLINPLEISKTLKNSEKEFEKIVIRKYIIPECKILIFVEEKSVWGKLIEHDKAGKLINGFKLITDKYDLLTLNNLDLSKLQKELYVVELISNDGLKFSPLPKVKLVADTLANDFKMPVSKFLILEDNNLEIFMKSGLRIKSGIIDDDILKRILKIKDILALVKYESGNAYLDLTLDSGAIFKAGTSMDNQNSRIKSFFSKLRR